MFKRLVRLATPSTVHEARAAADYKRSHSLSSGGVQLLRAYRDAGQYGLHLLPPGLRLDGLVVDIGANIGEFTSIIRRLEPTSRVLAFEPAPQPRARLQERFAGDMQVTIDSHALSDRAGIAELNVTADSVLSSLLPMRTESADLYGSYGAGVVSRPQVETARLDDLVTEPVRVLKIDVQGNETALLAGAERTIAQTDAVLIELMLVSHYEGDATFFELHPRMLELDFMLRSLGPVCIVEGRGMWMDGCYVPVSSA
jgi:FkbM family methyltransferase